MLCLLAGAVGEPDDREAGNSALEVRFHVDAASLEPDNSVRNRAREHAVTLGGQIARVRVIFVTCHGQGASLSAC